MENFVKRYFWLDIMAIIYRRTFVRISRALLKFKAVFFETKLGVKMPKSAEATLNRYMPIPQRNVFAFHKGPLVSLFHSDVRGIVIMPAHLVLDAAAAEGFMRSLPAGKLKAGAAFEIEPGRSVVLRSIGEGGRGLVFVPGLDQPYSAEYVLPETLPSGFFGRKGGAPKEYFIDSVAVCKANKGLIRSIEIEDVDVADFVRKKMSEDPRESGDSYIVVYHNYVDPDDNKIKLRSDGIVMVMSRYIGARKCAYVLVHKVRGSLLSKLPLETVLEEYPNRVIASTEQIKLSRQVYGGVYQKTDLKKFPAEEIRREWPFPLPKDDTFIYLKRAKVSLREQFTLYKKAVAEDIIFGLSAVGSLFQSAGKGLAEGALLLPILMMAQNELKVAALLGFMAKASVGFYLFANNRASRDVQGLEAKQTLGEVLNKQFPLWEMGARYKTTSWLMERYNRNSLSYLLPIAIYLQLFPATFKTIWRTAASIAPSAVFVAGYLSAEFMQLGTDAFEIRNSFKIAEDRLRNNPDLPDFRKNFWTINAFQENLEYVFYQASFLTGLGGYYLASAVAPQFQDDAAMAIGGLSLVLSCFRFLLPLFGREEKRARLEIGSPDFLRVGRTLKFSDNVALKLGDDSKVEIIEQQDKKRTILPDFENSGVRIGISNLDSITVRKHLRSRLLPFKFAQWHSVTLKTNDPRDPKIVFTIFGQDSVSVEDIKQRFIEERTDIT